MLLLTMYKLSYFCFTAVILSVCIDDTSAPIHKKKILFDGISNQLQCFDYLSDQTKPNPVLLPAVEEISPPRHPRDDLTIIKLKN